MISGLIPQRYAKALYKFALENHNTDKVYDEMKNVIESFQSNADLEKVMSNPYVATEDKERLLLKAAGEKPGDDYSRFVKLIIEHKREPFAYLMALAYRDIYRKENNISQADIKTAGKLPETEMDRLVQLVQKSFPGRKFEFSYSVDPELIGGFVITVDSVRMDASMSGELQQLRQNLLRNN